MNLIVRFTILFVFVAAIVFLIGGLITYEVMKTEIRLEEERFLRERLEQTKHYLSRRNPTQKFTRNKLIVEPLDSTTDLMQPVFSDTLVMHEYLQRQEPNRKLDAVIEVSGKKFKVTLFDLIVESDDIVEGVVESMVKTYLILLISVFIIGLLASYYISRPFRLTLEVIKSFSLVKPSNISFPKSSIKEFKKLNDFLSEMTHKVKADYESLKEFSENASHELQTPIAIIQGKMEVLIESPNLTVEQLKLITSTQNSIRRLSKLSSSLSLLTKIENKEFSNVSNIDLKKLINQLLDDFDELISLKHISLESKLGNLTLNADPVMIEIMMTNLINNAIRHNYENGNINIVLSNNSLIISNSGGKLTISPMDLFNRFKKSNQSDSSLGLGLAIVKKICDYYGFQIFYVVNDEIHQLTIKFQ